MQSMPEWAQLRLAYAQLSLCRCVCSDDIFDQIAEMEQKIQTLEEDIRKAEANAAKAIEEESSEELTYWRTEEQQLRTEKQQLREQKARKELEQRGKPTCSPLGVCVRITEACQQQRTSRLIAAYFQRSVRCWELF